jgi:integrase
VLIPLLTVNSSNRESAFLMPEHYEMLMRHGGMTVAEKTFVAFLIATGIRYREFIELSLTPNQYMRDRKVIKIIEHKAKRKVRSRYVKLSDWGLTVSDKFFEINGTMPINSIVVHDPSRYNQAELLKGNKVRDKVEKEIKYKWYYDEMANSKIKKWAKQAGLDPTYLSIKSLRKTAVVWLVAAHPDREGDIVQSIGHDVQTDIKHYRNTAFTMNDVLLARKYFYGWGFEDV